MKKAPVHAIYKRYDALFVIFIARSRVFVGIKWKFFRVQKRRERTFIHNLCPLCGRRRGASSADRVGRDPCVPPRSTHCSRRGTRVPPYRVRRSHGADRVVRPYTFCAGRRTPRAFVPLRSTAGRRPLHTLSLRASPRREASTLGVQTAAAIRFPSARPLDKPVGMGIIVDVRGRCDKRSAPVSENFNEPYGSQKPSLVGVAVFVFQLHNTNRNGIPPDVESKYPVHVCHPLSGL